MNRARVVTLNAALGPLDYRVPDGMHVEPGSVVVAPLGPRQLVGVVWEPERLQTEEVGDNRLRPLVGVLDVPPISAPLRRLCECAQPSTEPQERLGLDVERARLPIGCDACQGTGYRGRFLIAEMLKPESEAIGVAIRERRETQFLHQTAVAHGMVPNLARACQAVEQGVTSPAEVRRVFGFSPHGIQESITN